jgi:uncharacterized protein (TIGR02452 family)
MADEVEFAGVPRGDLSSQQTRNHQQTINIHFLPGIYTTVMGRDAPSVGQPPAAFRKNARSKKARATLNKVIPSLLTAHPRAKRGIDATELILQPKANGPQRKSTKEEGAPNTVPNVDLQIKLRVTGTLAAAHDLLKDPKTQSFDLSNRTSRVGVLNMASMLAPGGGFLNGASGQEASLCMNTTLLPSLSDEFYPLPEVSAIYTPDVLVFRDEHTGDLEKKNRWFVDCVSGGTLRFPSITVDESTGRGSYSNDKDRDLVLEKMRAVMRIFQAKKVSRVVLGAWGCGAFGHPVGEVAAAWKKVLLGSERARKNKKGKKEVWTGIETVMFAIKDPGLADAFAQAFGDGLIYEEEDAGEEVDDDADGDLDAVRLREMQEKIVEMHSRIQQARTPELKAGLTSILAGLEGQVPKTATTASAGSENSQGSDSGSDDDESDSDAAYSSHGT